MTVCLAEYQVRLLLCKPKRKELLRNGDDVRLHWECGCAASAISRKRYAIETCAQHSDLFAQITEGEERQYDAFGGEAATQRAWLRFPASASMRNT